KDVLRAIENLLKTSPDPEFNQRNFALVNYLDAKGESRPEYRLTHDAFAFLAMRFTGKEAMAWQIAFIQAFNALEAELQSRVTREAAALHQLRPLLAPVVAGTEQGQRRAAIGATINRSAASVSYHRRTARRLGLLPLAH
ncbi:MAG: Rha family transcriptional regulator, partial [Gallionella sp.]|nr:Rha family transcriptional regulator [Gallionella sp.]